jgi:aspartate/methionine/tyrosine aminotransferase
MKPERFALEAIFEEYEHAAGMLVLGASDASSPTVEELVTLCDAPVSFDAVRLAYGDVKGDIALREAIAHSYNPALNPEQVLVTIGGSEAIFVAMHALLESGNVALVITPAYQPLRSVPLAIGATVEKHQFRQRQDLTFDVDVGTLLRRIEQERPSLLVLNTPHNPTGHVLDEASLRMILGTARTAGTKVLVDEVFAGIWLDGTPPVPSALTLDETVVVVGSLSKTFGLSGLRLGWLAGRQTTLEACREMRHYTTIAPPLLVQTLASLAVTNRERLMARTYDIVSKNRRIAAGWLAEHREAFDWVEPRGGLVMLLRLRLPIEAQVFSHDLARKKSVFLVPCDSTFGMAKYLRLGLGIAPHVFEEGLARITEYLKEKSWQTDATAR